MKLSLIILGIFILIVGAFGYCIATVRLKIGFITIPNPFSAFQPLVWLILAVGAISLLLGIFWKGSEE